MSLDRATIEPSWSLKCALAYAVKLKYIALLASQIALKPLIQRRVLRRRLFGGRAKILKMSAVHELMQTPLEGLRVEESMRLDATSVCGLKLLVHAALI